MDLRAALIKSQSIVLHGPAGHLCSKIVNANSLELIDKPAYEKVSHG